MKKKFALLLCIAGLFAGCERYDHAIQDLNDRIEVLEGASIATIEEQISLINASLTELTAADAALSDYTATLEATAATLKEELAATDAQIDALKSELQGENAATKQTLLDQLAALKSTIETDIKAIEQEIAALKAKDAALEGQITGLKSYVDGQLAALAEEMNGGATDTEAWAKATFATLAQYDSLQTEVSAIKASIEELNTAIETLETRVNNKIATDIAAAVDSLGTVLTGDYTAKIGTVVSELTAAYTTAIATAKEEITAAYTEAIDTAIKNSEASMKQWVNEMLQEDYYKIAQVDALLGVLDLKVDSVDTALSGSVNDLNTKVDSVDTALSDSIAVQKAALAAAKSELTAAYTEAIEEITKNDGIIDTRISAAINAAKDELQGKINAINTEIDAIKGRLDALEGKVAALIARIQSIRYLPEYSDGKVELTSDNAPVTLTFLLSPKAAAQAVATAYESNNSVVTAYLSRTQSRTRAVDAPAAINVTNVTGTAEGVLTVTINTENLPADYWAAADEANLFIRISDGNNDVISEIIPVFYSVICELPNGDEFRNAVHAQLTNDTKAIKFIANSAVVTDKQIGTAPAYMQLNGTTLEIHTRAKEFVFNADCSFMFSGSGATKFKALTSIDFNDCVNTANVTNMRSMFYYCSALASLNLSKFNTANVMNMSNMFYYCSALASLNLSSFNTEKVTSMSYMFSDCTALASLNLSSFNTEKVTDMGSMFYYCSALASLNLSSFNTEKVTSMNYMFSGCSALTSLDLSSFNTAEVTFMRNMFSSCKALTSLDIRNFNIDNVTNIDLPFYKVGEEYNKTTGNPKTSIMVTSTLKTALTGKGVSPGNFAEYYVTDEQPM